MKKISIGLILVCFLISGCRVGEIFGPTPTPTPTITPTATLTSTPTLTPIPSETPTITPSPSPTAGPGLGVKTQKLIDTFDDLLTFSPSTDANGDAAQVGTTEEGFTTMTLTGDPDLVRAELRIDLSKEGIATIYWILFLEVTSNGGKEAADWVHDNFEEAQNGKVEKVFGKAKVTLESTLNGKLFLLTVSPASDQ